MNYITKTPLCVFAERCLLISKTAHSGGVKTGLLTELLQKTELLTELLQKTELLTELLLKVGPLRPLLINTS